jgi:hypothetical protein
MAKKCKICGCDNPFPMQSTCQKWECREAWQKKLDEKKKGRKTSREIQYEVYYKLIGPWKQKNPICAVCKKRKTQDVHHMKGKEGTLLIEVEFWLPVCRPCHTKINDDSKWAIEQGYSLKRNGSFDKGLCSND